MYRYLEGIDHKLDDNNDTHNHRILINWRAEMLKDPWKLGTYLGKRSCKIWLHEEGPSFSRMCAFLVSLKYYCVANGRRRDDFESLQQLAANKFSLIREYFGTTTADAIEGNLGLAYFALHQWNDASVNLKVRGRGIKDEFFWSCLGRTCMETGDYDEAAAVYRAIAENSRHLSKEWFQMVGLAYKAKGDALRAIEAFMQASPWNDLELLDYGEVYAVLGDYRKEIELYEGKFRFRVWWTRECHAQAFISMGNFKGAIKVYQESKKDPRGSWSVARLRKESAIADSNKTPQEISKTGTLIIRAQDADDISRNLCFCKIQIKHISERDTPFKTHSISTM